MRCSCRSGAATACSRTEPSVPSSGSASDLSHWTRSAILGFMAPDSPEAKRRAAAVRQIADAVNSRDLERAARHFHPEVEIVTREGPVHGIRYFQRFFEVQYESFSEFRLEVEEIFEAGDGTVIACFAVD